MTSLAKYVVSLEAQTAKYVRELEKANRKLDAFHKTQERSISKIRDAFQGLGSTLAAVLSVRAIAQFTASSIALADQIGKTARAAGVSAEELQKLRFAFDDLGGISAAQTDTALQRFNRTLGAAIGGTKEASNAFMALGIAMRDSSGKAIDTDAALDAALRSLAGIESVAERSARASKLFGEEIGPKLAAALYGGIEAMNAAKEAATGVFTDATVAKAEALGDAWDRIVLASGNFVRNAAIAVTYDLAKVFGIDELSSGVKAMQIQLAELRHEREMIARQQAAGLGTVRGTAELDKEIGLVEQQIKYEQLLRTPFVTPRGAINATVDNAALMHFIEQAKQADDLTQSMRTSEEQRSEAIRAANELYAEGLISLQTYQRTLQSFADNAALLEQNRAVVGLGTGSLQMLPELAGLEERNALMAEAEEALTETIFQHHYRRAEIAADFARQRVATEEWVAETTRGYQEMVATSGIGLLQALGSEHRGAAIAAIAIEKTMAITRTIAHGKATAVKIKAEYALAAAAHLAATAGFGTAYAAALNVQGSVAAARVLTQSYIASALTGLEGAVQIAQLSDRGVDSTLGTSANPVFTQSSSLANATSMSNSRSQRVVELHIHGNYYGTGGARKLAEELENLVEYADVVLVSNTSRNGMDLRS